MFETAGVLSMRRVFSALSIVSLAALLAACAHPSPPDPGRPKSWVVENVSSKTTAELYADVVRPAKVVDTDNKVIDGYTVESAMLRMPGALADAKDEGYLITVRSPDGSLFGIINRPEKIGTFQVNSNGSAYFTPGDTGTVNGNDVVKLASSAESLKSTAQGAKAESTIDIFIVYTRDSIDSGHVSHNVKADALARVELINRAIRNTGDIPGVTFRLVGTNIHEPFEKINSDTLSRLGTWYANDMKNSGADLLAMFLGPRSQDGMTIGLAYTPGRYSLSVASNSTVFPHEIGHNVGGVHCPGASDADPGYRNGYTSSIQCGDTQLHYSTIYFPGQTGPVRGDANRANMARLWRENAPIMAAYNSLGRLSTTLTNTQGGPEAEARLSLETHDRNGMGVVALSSLVGPTALEASSKLFTSLKVILRNSNGVAFTAVITARKAVYNPPWQTAMNSSASVGSGEQTVYLYLRFPAISNLLLPAGRYTGKLDLKLIDVSAPHLNRNISVDIDAWKP
jgi:hypothetical protein